MIQLRNADAAPLRRHTALTKTRPTTLTKTLTKTLRSKKTGTPMMAYSRMGRTAVAPGFSAVAPRESGGLSATEAERPPEGCPGRRRVVMNGYTA